MTVATSPLWSLLPPCPVRMIGKIDLFLLVRWFKTKVALKILANQNTAMGTFSPCISVSSVSSEFESVQEYLFQPVGNRVQPLARLPSLAEEGQSCWCTVYKRTKELPFVLRERRTRSKDVGHHQDCVCCRGIGSFLG